jgi:hypothetical protein
MINANSFVGQFILCQTEDYISENWNIRRSGSWCLGYHQDLPVIEILASDSSFIGWLLGYAIDSNGQLLTKNLQISVSANDSNNASQLEESLYAIGGRFVAIFLTENLSRVYLDPLASLSTVFCAPQQIVASSPNLIPYSEDSQDNYELINTLDIPNKDNWYPFGLTPRHSVERILPNHCLDLSNWQAIRHWPVNELAILQDQDVEGAIYEITSIVKNNIKAIVQHYPVYIALTGGRDSRMLLACALEHLKDINFFTINIPDEKGKLDYEIASKIAKKYSLNYKSLEVEEASETELNEWLNRTGNCVAGRTWRNVHTLKQLDPQRGLLLGMAGEIGRCIFWRDPSYTESTPISDEKILQLLQLPITPYLKEKTNQWVKGLATNNTFTLLDFVFIEQRIGCWAGPQQYGHITSAFRIYPFCNRKAVELMLSLPPSYRRSQKMADDMINNIEPELLKFPFNKPMGLKGYLSRFKQLAQSSLSRFSR